MKRLFFILIALLFNLLVLADDKKTEKEIFLELRECVSDTDRDYSPQVSAIYRVSSGIIQINLFEIDNYFVYFVDSNGHVVDCRQSPMGATTICMDAPPVPGCYYLIIESSRLYAEGLFEVN